MRIRLLDPVIRELDVLGITFSNIAAMSAHPGDLILVTDDSGRTESIKLTPSDDGVTVYWSQGRSFRTLKIEAQ